MLRKFALGLVAAIAVVGATASMPTAASARGGHHGGGHHGGWHGGGHHGGWHHGGGWRHGHHRGWGPRFYVGGPAYYGGCYARRLVPTPWGPRWRTVKRCY